jgi:hypothetical protein
MISQQTSEDKKVQMAKDPGQKRLGKTEPNNPVSNLTCHDIPTLAQPGPINVCHAHINDPSTYTAHSLNVQQMVLMTKKEGDRDTRSSVSESG